MMGKNSTPLRIDHGKLDYYVVTCNKQTTSKQTAIQYPRNTGLDWKQDRNMLIKNSQYIL